MAHWANTKLIAPLIIKTNRPDCLVGHTLAQCEGWGMVILGKYSSDA